MKPTAALVITVSAATGCWVEEDWSTACVVPRGGEFYDAPLPGDPDATQYVYEADRPVDFVFERRLGDDETRRLRCTVTREGDEFVLAGAYERNTRKWGDSDFIQSVYVRCTSEALPAGDYSFTFAGQRQSFTIPATAPAPCVVPGGG